MISRTALICTVSWHSIDTARGIMVPTADTSPPMQCSSPSFGSMHNHAPVITYHKNVSSKPQLQLRIEFETARPTPRASRNQIADPAFLILPHPVLITLTSWRRLFPPCRVYPSQAARMELTSRWLFVLFLNTKGAMSCVINRELHYLDITTLGAKSHP